MKRQKRVWGRHTPNNVWETSQFVSQTHTHTHAKNPHLRTCHHIFSCTRASLTTKNHQICYKCYRVCFGRHVSQPSLMLLAPLSLTSTTCFIRPRCYNCQLQFMHITFHPDRCQNPATRSIAECTHPRAHAHASLHEKCGNAE